ncbi:hypothetical protein F4780DRAFT_591154 [Xylariomycetidae sp. FL0641]|nr:hypothetical protein F4780DRAFT_591154 [Xylariomycetidae sp. FL0641]
MMDGPGAGPADGHGHGHSETGKKVAAKLIPKKFTPQRWKKQPSLESFGSTASSEGPPRGRETLRTGSVSTTTTTLSAQSHDTAAYADHDDDGDGGGDQHHSGDDAYTASSDHGFHFRFGHIRISRTRCELRAAP